MVCFETREEANIAIQDRHETTRYKAKEFQPKNNRQILTTKVKLTPLQQMKKKKGATC